MKNIFILFFVLQSVMANATQINLCVGDTELFEGYSFKEPSSTISGINEETFKWFLIEFPDNANYFIGDTGTVKYQFNMVGQYVFMWEHYITNEGNSSTFSGFDTIIVHDIPPITIGDTIICQGQPVILSNDYDWSIENPIPLLGVSYYIASKVNEYGCINIDTMVVTVVDCENGELEHIEFKSIYIPNVFSPNGDGINDLFTYYTKTEMKVLTITIWDRWGGLRFITKDSNWWDGGDCGQGVYLYYFLLEDQNGKQYNLHGDVTLIK